MPRAKQNSNPTLPNLTSKKSNSTLDGLIAELYKKAYTPFDSTQKIDHLDSLRSIHQKLIQIQKLEKNRIQNGERQSGNERMNILSAWVNEKGIKLDGIKFASDLNEGCGVVAMKKFEEGELISSIPTSLMMTTATAMDSKDDVGLLCKNDPWLCQVPSLILTTHLLFEKHKSEESVSKWKGYIQSLPGQHCLNESNGDGKEDMIMPLAFSMSTIEALKGTLALEELYKMMKTILKQYCHMYLLLQRFKNLSPSISKASSWFTFAEFRWAASIVMTRQHQIPFPASNESQEAHVASPCMALIPILDMFNHEEGMITSHFNTDNEVMEVNAKRLFQEGEQVFISYGRRPNVMLLLYSGFISPNTHDKIRLMLDLPPSDSLYSKKLALLKWLELPPTVHLDLFCNGTPSRELMTWIKVIGLESPTALDKALRSVIASRAEETARKLRSQTQITEPKEPNAEVQNGAAEKNDVPLSAVQALVENLKSTGEKKKGGDKEEEASFVSKEKDGLKELMDGVFTAHHWRMLSSVCESKLKEMGCIITYNDGDDDKNGKSVHVVDKISLSLSKEKDKVKISREKELALCVRALEINALKSAMELSQSEVVKVVVEK